MLGLTGHYLFRWKKLRFLELSTHGSVMVNMPLLFAGKLMSYNYRGIHCHRCNDGRCMI